MKLLQNFVMRNEGKIVIVVSTILIMLNLTCLVFILRLLNSNEIIRYLEDGGIVSASPRGLSFVLLLTTMLNVLFVFTALVARLMAK
jgi:hypothetical protein|nr:hypothetical protein [uncultured Flavobacterium sp.]